VPGWDRLSGGERAAGERELGHLNRLFHALRSRKQDELRGTTVKAYTKERS
jgi:hypothetical protein